MSKLADETLLDAKIALRYIWLDAKDRPEPFCKRIFCIADRALTSQPADRTAAGQVPGETGTWNGSDPKSELAPAAAPSQPAPTPRTEAVNESLRGRDIHYWWQSYANLASDLERELAAANQSRDEWVTLYTTTKQELAAAKAEIKYEREWKEQYYKQSLLQAKQYAALQARLDAPVDLPLTEKEIETWRKWICGLFTRHIFTEEATGNAICDQALAAIALARKLNAPCPELPEHEKGCGYLDALRNYCCTCNLVGRLRGVASTLARKLRIAELKNQGTLANNLCPDHRDKQTGKPCLACEIETLARKLAEAEKDAGRYRYIAADPRNRGSLEWLDATEIDAHIDSALAGAKNETGIAR